MRTTYLVNVVGAWFGCMCIVLPIFVVGALVSYPEACERGGQRRIEYLLPARAVACWALAPIGAVK